MPAPDADLLHPALLYAPGCRFCCVAAAAILRWDRRRVLRPVALGSAEADRLLDSLQPSLREDSFHVVEIDGTIHSAGAAAPVLARLLPGGGPLAITLGAAAPLTERAYRAIADNRSRIGRHLPNRIVARARAEIADRAR